MKTAYFLGLQDNPNAYQYGKYHCHVNACEVWVDLEKGDVVEVIEFDTEKKIGLARIVNDVNANIISVCFLNGSVRDEHLAAEIAKIDASNFETVTD